MSTPARALFLDCDGVINRDSGYTHRWEDFVFIDGIFDLSRAACERGYRLMVVTNQAGIGRGLYAEKEFLSLTERMCERFAEEGAMIDKVYYDPTHPEHGIGEYRRISPMRKPNPGMLLAAADEFGLSLPHSILIGDKISDLQAGIAAKVGCNLLYRGAASADEDASAVRLATAVLHDLRDAVPYLN